jgi:hypothetical protein
MGSSIQVRDFDSEHKDIFVSLLVEYGVLTVDILPVASLQLVDGSTGENDVTLSMIGTVSDINIALTSLRYTPKPHWNSRAAGFPDLIRLVANDNGYSGGNVSIPLTAYSTVVIIVQHGTYHIPYLQLPNATYRTVPCESLALTGQNYGEKMCTSILAVPMFYIYEDETTSIYGLSIHSEDMDEWSNRIVLLSLSCLHGNLSLPMTTQYGVTVVNGISSMNRSVTLRGTVQQLNSALQHTQYISEANYYGSESIALSLSVQGVVFEVGSTDENHNINATVPVTVLPVIDTPTIKLPYDQLEVGEDYITVISGLSIQDNDFIDVIAGDPTYLLLLGREFDKTYPWNATLSRKLKGSLLQIQISSLWGQFMFPTGLNELKVLNAPNEISNTDAADMMPSIATSEQRNAYSSASASNVTTGAPQQLWWSDILIEGRLGDINRALRGFT